MATKKKAARKTTRRATTRAATTRRTTAKRTTRKRARRRSTRSKAITFRPVGGKVYRRNPPGGKLLKMVTQGVQDAGLIVGGKAATNVVAGLIPFQTTSTVMQFAKQLASAAVVGIVAGKVLSKEQARLLFAGGLVAPIETFAKGLHLPVVSDALGDGLGSYVQPAGLGSYYVPPALPVPQGGDVAGLGDESYEYMQ